MHLLQFVSIPVLRVHIILSPILLTCLKRVQLYGRRGLRDKRKLFTYSRLRALIKGWVVEIQIITISGWQRWGVVRFDMTPGCVRIMIISVLCLCYFLRMSKAGWFACMEQPLVAGMLLRLAWVWGWVFFLFLTCFRRWLRMVESLGMLLSVWVVGARILRSLSFVGIVGVRCIRRLEFSVKNAAPRLRLGSSVRTVASG